MKYFTPELYAKINSQDDDLADQADAEWESALRRYRCHFNKIEPALLEALWRFCAESVCTTPTSSPRLCSRVRPSVANW
jgi:hypothetical protein